MNEWMNPQTKKLHNFVHEWMKSNEWKNCLSKDPPSTIMHPNEQTHETMEIEIRKGKVPNWLSQCSHQNFHRLPIASFWPCGHNRFRVTIIIAAASSQPFPEDPPGPPSSSSPPHSTIFRLEVFRSASAASTRDMCSHEEPGFHRLRCRRPRHLPPKYSNLWVSNRRERASLLAPSKRWNCQPLNFSSSLALH